MVLYFFFHTSYGKSFYKFKWADHWNIRHSKIFFVSSNNTVRYSRHFSSIILYCILEITPTGTQRRRDHFPVDRCRMQHFSKLGKTANAFFMREIFS